MSRRISALALFCAGLVSIQSVAGQSRVATQPFPELTPLPLSEQLAAAREPLPVESIVDAALEFSGASEADAAGAKDKLAVLLRKFRDEVADVTNQTELAEKALAFLHKNLFTAYSFPQTRVDTVMDTGVYNCVSSAIIYMIVARSVGLSVSGVRTRDHAFCSVLVNGQQLDVETTSAYGFNPGSKKEFLDSFGKVTGYAYEPPGNYVGRRGIGEKELLALILYNTVAEDADVRLYHDALQPAVSFYVLMGSDESRQMLVGVLASYITSIRTRQDFAQGAQFIDAVKASFGGSVDISQARRDFYHNWVLALFDDNVLQEAEDLLAQPITKATLDDADWNNFSVMVVQRRAQAQANTGDFVSAAGVVQEAIGKLGRLPILLQNYEALMQNAIVQLYNARKYADARTLVDQGLASYAESRIFQQDLDLLKKQMKQ
jgi:hypothetical protein